MSACGSMPHSSGLMPRAANQSRAARPSQRVAGVAQRAGEGVVETVCPHTELVLADRHEVEAHAGGEAEGPIVLRHAGEDVLRGELPAGRHHAVLDPERVIALAAQGGVKARVLRDLVRLLARAGAAHFGFVQLQVLQGGNRFNHLPVGAEVVELRFRQRHHRAGQRADRRVPRRRGLAQGEAELGVKLVAARRAAVEPAPLPAAALHQHAHGPLAQQPHAGVHQADIILRQRADFRRGRFLEEEGEFGRLAARGEEDAKVLGLFRGHPHAEAEHIHVGEGRQFAGKAQQHVAAGNQRGGGRPGVGQHALVVGQLQVQQRLVEALPARPAEHGDGHEQLAGGRVGGQAPAQAARVQDELAALPEPAGKRLAGSGRAPGLGQEIGRAAARAERLAGRDRRWRTTRAAAGLPALRTRPPCAAEGSAGVEQRFRCLA